MSLRDVVIVGSGEAGVGVALALRAHGFVGGVRIVGGEPMAYHRPPLSKGFIDGSEGFEAIESINDDDRTALRIDASFGEPVTAIDRAAKEVVTVGERIRYDHLVLATGATNRSLTERPIEGLLQLRTLDDAVALRDSLRSNSSIVIVGAGFLGLEVASVAADLGLDVEVVEFAQTPLGGRVSAPTVQAIEAYLRSRGIRFSLGVGVESFESPDGALAGVRLTDGRHIATNLALACVGVVPDTALAEAAGLRVANGVEVDEHLVTSDPDVSAIGDCASYPSLAGPRIRVESIANALGQADTVARRLTGATDRYDAVPWFWSVYGPHRMEIVGAGADFDEVIVHGNPLRLDFAAYCFARGDLVRFESLNRPREHMKMRRLFAKGRKPTPSMVGAPDFSLAEWPPPSAPEN